MPLLQIGLSYGAEREDPGRERGDESTAALPILCVFLQTGGICVATINRPDCYTLLQGDSCPNRVIHACGDRVSPLRGGFDDSREAVPESAK